MVGRELRRRHPVHHGRVPTTAGDGFMPSPAPTPRPGFDGHRRSESGAGHADATHEAAMLGCRNGSKNRRRHADDDLRIPLRGASVHPSSRHAAEKAAHPPSCGRSLLSRCGGSCLRSAGGCRPPLWLPVTGGCPYHRMWGRLTVPNRIRASMRRDISMRGVLLPAGSRRGTGDPSVVRGLRGGWSCAWAI